MDALPADPPAYHYSAASDLSPRDAQERKLCEKASSPDYLYMLPLLALNVGAIWLDAGLKYQDQPGVRLFGPAAVGLAWGGLVGGTYLALPKCDPHYVSYAPVEGDVRATWPLALALGVLAGATAPVVVGIETGPLPSDWTTEERVMRLVLAGTSGFLGALVPYLLPPKTWRAAKELENLRFSATPQGAMAGISFAF